ncbi:MAG: restriction endonuclease subunit S [Acidobacteria bacterium]|nr:restriction endonuclease subunit S [Acidobacteriota bacterium]
MSDTEKSAGWKTIPLGEIVNFEYGKSLTAKDRVSGGEFEVYGSSGCVGWHNEPYVKEPCLIVGRKGNVGSVFISNKPCWPIDTVYYLVPPKGIFIKYLYYHLNHLNLGHLDKSTAIPSLNRNDAYKVPVNMAPLEQQKRIVAKIEELFSHIDAGIEALKKAKQLLKQYRQSVLKAAVTGELTKEWREANKDKLEPASQLLERILKERRQKWEEQQLEQFKVKGNMPKDDKWKEKYKVPVQAENVTELEDLPDNWKWVFLDSLIVDGPQNGLYLPKTKYGSGVPIVRIDDFQDGYVRPYNNLQKVNANKSEVETYSLQKGNLVINRVNSPTHLGKCMVVKEGYDPCLFESNMMKSELSSNVSSEYVDYYIQSKFGRSKLIRNAKWAVNQASINQQDVKNTEITLPPFEEQSEIKRLVSEKFDGIDRLNNELDIQLSKAEKNRQSILASAFSGKV